jgi:hypothetical protein
LFAGFCVFSFTGLFDIIETRFYSKSILNELDNDLAADTEFIDNYLYELQKRFSDVLNENAIRNSFWVNQDSEDIYERGRIFSSLGISLPELQWVRFVDVSGDRIHYSTNPDDQILSGAGTILYKNYPEVTGYLPFDQQMLSGINMHRIVFDGESERLIFYYPFYDSMDIHRGEALFSISIRAFSERLMENTPTKMTVDISAISSPNGIVIGIPRMEIEAVKKAVASVWESGAVALSRIYASPSNPMVLLSSKTSQGIFVGLIVSEKLFTLPDTLKALMIASVFTTLFVVMFLIFNVKQDPVAVVQNRLKELQVSLMHEYYQLMGDMDWAVWRRELEQRRADVKQELCRGLKIKKGGDVESYIDSFFNRSWDGLIAAIGSRTGMITTFDEAKLEAILSRVLTSAKPADFSDFQSADDGNDDELEELPDEELTDEELTDIDEILDDDSVEDMEPLDDAVSGDEYSDVEEFSDEDTGILALDEGQGDGVEELKGIDELEEFPRQGGAEWEYEDLDMLPAEPAAKGEPGDSGQHDVEEFNDSDSENISLNVYSPKYLWATIYDEDTAAASENEAWRKLAEETAAMEPSEIWEELSGKPETPEVPETVNGADENPTVFNGDILEEDPFQDAVPETLSDNAGGLVDLEEVGYGEFIPGAVEESPPVPVFSMDPLYNVEEFADADDEDGADGFLMQAVESHTFEISPKQDDIDETAMKIEFSPPVRSEPIEDFNVDVISPLNEKFTDRGNDADKRESTVPAVDKTPVKTLEVKPQKRVNPPARINAATQSYFQFFPQDGAELEFLEAADEEEDANAEETVIKKRNGVDYIDAAALEAASAEAKTVDQKMKNLVDSVLRKT